MTSPHGYFAFLIKWLPGGNWTVYVVADSPQNVLRNQGACDLALEAKLFYYLFKVRQNSLWEAYTK